MMRTIEFTKMHAAGNDYIYVYGQDFSAADASRLAGAWCDRNKGIGADGIVLINPSDKADFRMEMFNADGSQGMMCGNAARCIGSFVASHGYAKDFDITLETASGIKLLHIDNATGNISVNMGKPSFADRSQFLPDKESSIPEEFRGCFVSMGNPHYVIFVEDIEAVDPEITGRQLEHADCFPASANIEFAQLLGPGSIRMRVWERGSGVTMACGTGACATAVTAIRRFSLGRVQKVMMDGGSVKVCWNKEEEVTLTGDAVEVFNGTIDIEE